jgi:TRAP-type transport system periplasmic protein
MRRLTLFIAGFAAAGLALATNVQAKEFVFGSWVSPKHGTNRDGLGPMFEAVKKETKGEVSWKILAGGQVVSARSTLAGIRDRIVDGGLVIPVFTRKDLPVNNVVFDMQAFGDDPVAVAGASTEVVMQHCPECLAEYKKNKTVYVGGYGVTPFQVMCKQANITHVSQLEGLKIRAIGAGMRWVQAAKAVPVGIPPTEALTGMQRGAVDCILGSVAWLRSYGYIDVVKTFVEFNTGFPRAVCLLCVNRDAWNGLTDAQKRVMWKEMAGATSRATIVGYVDEDLEVKKLAQARGIAFVKGGDDFKAMMAKHRDAERKNLMAAFKNIGVKDPKRIMGKFDSLYPEWEKMSDTINNDVGKFAAALDQRIYSKIDPTKWFR